MKHEEIDCYNLGFRTFGMLEQCDSGDLMYYKDHAQIIFRTRLNYIKIVNELRNKNLDLSMSIYVYKLCIAILAISTITATLVLLIHK